MRFSLRSAFVGFAVICAALAIVRAVANSVTPITVTADRPDVIAYLDGEELGPVPAKISWSRLYRRYGLSGTGPFDGTTLESHYYGIFLRKVRRPDGGCILIYLKPADEANAVDDGLVLVDSPYGKIVDPQLCVWFNHNRTAHFRADLPHDSAPRARIIRAELRDDGLVHVELRFPFTVEALRSAAGPQVQVILAHGTFSDWRFVSKSEVVEVSKMKQEGGSMWHRTTIGGNYADEFQWVHATVTNSTGYRITGIGYHVRSVTLKDGKLFSSSETDSTVVETEVMGGHGGKRQREAEVRKAGGHPAQAPMTDE